MPPLQIESRAVWDEDADEWTLRGMELAGNRLRVRRPPSSTSAAMASLLTLAPMAEARPRSQYAAARQAYEPDHPRFRGGDNVAVLELEMPARTTEDYAGPAVASKVKISGQVRAVMRSSGTM
jgi:kinesin family protein 3/17